MSTGNSKSIQRRRKRLLEKHPFCYWCGIRVEEYVVQNREPLPPHAATLDHVFDKWDPERKEIGNDVRFTILSCNKCNHARGLAKQKQQGIKTLRSRSKRKKKRMKTKGLSNFMKP